MAAIDLGASAMSNEKDGETKPYLDRKGIIRLPAGLSPEVARNAVNMIVNWWDVSADLDELELVINLYDLFKTSQEVLENSHSA